MEEIRPSEAPPPIRLPAESPVAEAVSNALGTGVSWLNFYEPTARSGDVEGIHQFRVTVRRLRATVELAAPVLHATRVRYYRAELPAAGHCAGAVRDCDVMGGLLRQHCAALDPVNARALTPAFQALADNRVVALREMIGFIGSRRYARLTARLAPTLTRKFPPEITTRVLAPALLRPLLRSAQTAGSRLAIDSPPPVYHRLRVRLKRVRYAFEMLGDGTGKRTAKALKRLRRIQDELGEHQDLVNTGLWLREFASRAPVAPETLIATGALIQFTGERRVKVAAKAFKRWQKFVHGSALTGAQEEITKLASQPATPTIVGPA